MQGDRPRTTGTGSRRPLTCADTSSERPRTTPAGSLGGRRQAFLPLELTEDVRTAMDEFGAVHTSKTGSLDLEFFVEAQCALASALGKEPDAIASTSCFFELVGIASWGSHQPRDIFMRWQTSQDVMKHSSPELLAEALRRVARELLEKRKEARPMSKHRDRALLDSRTRGLAQIEAFSEDRTEQQRQKETQAAERHAARSRKQAAEQNFLAMLALEKGDKEAQRKALDREIRFLRQAACAEAEARRRMGGHDRLRG